MDRELELTAEIRKARTWILVVGLLMFTIDMVLVYGLQADELPDEAKNLVLVIDVGILGFFVGMWALAKRRPYLACVLALGGFWAIHLVLAFFDGTSLFQGLILKILFTLALVRGIKAASRAEDIKRDLAQIFD
jgi:peptidoglycan/LPS O-acetylase OafA/YrhL